eukprot:symbB.v1.2.017485.t1/scaffold1363.1/size124464/11
MTRWNDEDKIAPHAAAAATKREGRRCTGSKCLSNTSGADDYQRATTFPAALVGSLSLKHTQVEPLTA